MHAGPACMAWLAIVSSLSYTYSLTYNYTQCHGPLPGFTKNSVWMYWHRWSLLMPARLYLVLLLQWMTMSSYIICKMVFGCLLGYDRYLVHKRPCPGSVHPPPHDRFDQCTWALSIEEVSIWSMCMMCFCTSALYPKHNDINTRLTCKVSTVILALLTFGVVDNKETQITYGSKWSCTASNTWNSHVTYTSWYIIGWQSYLYLYVQSKWVNHHDT